MDLVEKYITTPFRRKAGAKVLQKFELCKFYKEKMLFRLIYCVFGLIVVSLHRK